MSDRGIARLRLASQRLSRALFAKPADVVRWMGAVQAQDLAASLWAVGIRMKRGRHADVERALERAEIVRTWPMRGTIHLLPPEDARWMVGRLAPRAIQRAAGRRRQLGITEAVLARSRSLLRKALEGGKHLTRPAAYDLLAKHGVRTTGQRGIHILGHLAQEGLLCLGPREGKQPTFTLMDEWVRKTRASPTRQQGISALAARYVASHGPATVQDFAWWTGLAVSDARRGVEGAKGLREEDGRWSAAGRAAPASGRPSHLLPAFDEMLVGYRDRSSSLERLSARKVAPGVGLLSPALAVDGQIIGTWGRSLAKEKVVVTLRWLTRPNPDERERIAAAAQRYADFLGLPLTLKTSG